MSTVAATILAAVVASLLTGSAGFGAIYWQQRKSDQSAIARARSQAYADLYAISLSALFRGRSARDAMKQGSGLAAGLDPEIRMGWLFTRKLEWAVRSSPQPNAMEVHDWIAKVSHPLDSAVARVHVYGTKQGIDLADNLVGLCGDFLKQATTPGTARGKILTYFAGIAWTEAENKQLDELRDKVLQARKALRNLAREELAKTSDKVSKKPAQSVTEAK